jgi:putative membrane protein
MTTADASAEPVNAPSASASDGALMPAVRVWIMAAIVTTVITGLVYALADVGTRVNWFKTLHVIAVISWFAGIFYLPRLFVYHATVEDDDVRGHERFLIMERKLYRFITPFLVMTVTFGTLMIVEYGMDYFRLSRWLHIKITLVLFIIGYHGWLGFHGRALRLGTRTRDHKFYRVVNELPVLLLFAVVGLVILKPI